MSELTPVWIRPTSAVSSAGVPASFHAHRRAGASLAVAEALHETLPEPGRVRAARPLDPRTGECLWKMTCS